MQLVLERKRRSNLVAVIESCEKTKRQAQRCCIKWVVVEVDGDDGTQSCLWLSTGALPEQLSELQAPSSLASTKSAAACCEGGVRTFFRRRAPTCWSRRCSHPVQSTAKYPGPIAEKAGVNINSLHDGVVECDRFFSFSFSFSCSFILSICDSLCFLAFGCSYGCYSIGLVAYLPTCQLSLQVIGHIQSHLMFNYLTQYSTCS